MVTIKRIHRVKKNDAPVEFVSSYHNGRPSGAGLHLSIATFAKFYQSLFTLPTHNQHRFEVALGGPYGDNDGGDDENDNKGDKEDHIEDDDKENTPPDNQANPWKVSRDEIMLYDDIFPETAATENAKSNKNKVGSHTHLFLLSTSMIHIFDPNLQPRLHLSHSFFAGSEYLPTSFGRLPLATLRYLP